MSGLATSQAGWFLGWRGGVRCGKADRALHDCGPPWAQRQERAKGGAPSFVGAMAVFLALLGRSLIVKAQSGGIWI